MPVGGINKKINIDNFILANFWSIFLKPQISTLTHKTLSWMLLIKNQDGGGGPGTNKES
jgi:hypothetical protein